MKNVRLLCVKSIIGTDYTEGYTTTLKENESIEIGKRRYGVIENGVLNPVLQEYFAYEIIPCITLKAEMVEAITEIVLQHNFTKEQIRELIREELEDYKKHLPIRKIKEENVVKPQKEEKYISRVELAKLYNVSYDAMKGKLDNIDAPKSKILYGSRVYNMVEVMEYLDLQYKIKKGGLK